MGLISDGSVIVSHLVLEERGVALQAFTHVGGVMETAFKVCLYQTAIGWDVRIKKKETMMRRNEALRDDDEVV